MTMSNLIDNINARFLVCKYCNEPYKKPKVLSCLHVFCSECIQDLFDCQNNHGCRYKKPVSCYVCHKKTAFPTGGGVSNLPDSLTIINLAAAIGKGRVKQFNSNLRCEICTQCRYADSRCVECSKVLCKSCVSDHRKCRVTSSHCIFDLKIKNSVVRLNCTWHEHETVKYFCENCSICICVVCTFDKHKEHSVIDFREALKGKNEELNKLSQMCKEKLMRTKGQLDAMKQCELQIKEAESCIRYMAIESIAEIRKNERALIRDLHDLYGEETVEILKKSDQLNQHFKKMQSHSKLNELYLGTDELLIVQNDVKMKMNDVISGLDVNIPNTVTRKVKVLPVIVKPGQIEEDMGDIDMLLEKSFIDANDNNINLDICYSKSSQTNDVIIVTEPLDTPKANTNRVTSRINPRDAKASSVKSTQTQTRPTVSVCSQHTAIGTISSGCNTVSKMRLDKASGTSRIRHQDNKATLTEGLITSDACTSTETIDIAHAYIKALNGGHESISNIHRNSLTTTSPLPRPLAPPRKHRIDINAVLKLKSSKTKSTPATAHPSPTTLGDKPIIRLGKAAD